MQQDRDLFDRRCVVGPVERASSHHVFDCLRVNLDTRNGGVEWRRPEIEQAGRARADQNDAALDLITRHLACQHLGGGYEFGGPRVTEVETERSVGFDRNVNIADADRVQACRLAECGLAAGV